MHRSSVSSARLALPVFQEAVRPVAVLRRLTKERLEQRRANALQDRQVAMRERADTPVAHPASDASTMRDQRVHTPCPAWL